MNNLKYKGWFLRHLIASPIIWVMIIPLFLMDFLTEIYHRICFPLYGLRYVRRKEHIKIDRHKLKYLTPLQKIQCVYCGYANGVASYLVEILAKTEQYWCGIAHKKDKNFEPPKHHKDFAKYNDEKGFKKKYIK